MREFSRLRRIVENKHVVLSDGELNFGIARWALVYGREQDDETPRDSQRYSRLPGGVVRERAGGASTTRPRSKTLVREGPGTVHRPHTSDKGPTP